MKRPLPILTSDKEAEDFIDNTDLLLVDNDKYNYKAGYFATDINGDNFVDSYDLTIVDNNVFNYIGVLSPIANSK